MTAPTTQRDRIERTLRWTARALATLLALLILFFVIGEGPPPLTWSSAAFGCVFVGFLVAWVNDLAAATLILGGLIVFYAINFAGYGRLPGGPVFPLMYVPGVLLLAARIGHQAGVSKTSIRSNTHVRHRVRPCAR